MISTRTAAEVGSIARTSGCRPACASCEPYKPVVVSLETHRKRFPKRTPLLRESVDAMTSFGSGSVTARGSSRGSSRHITLGSTGSRFAPELFSPQLRWLVPRTGVRLAGRKAARRSPSSAAPSSFDSQPRFRSALFAGPAARAFLLLHYCPAKVSGGRPA